MIQFHGKDPVPILWEARWAPGPVWTGVENLAHTGIRSPDRPARSESLYRLSYPGPREADYLRMHVAVVALSHTPSWHAMGQLYLFM
jgi:hypothetical protein